MISFMPSSLHVVRAGHGPPVLLIHGSAADHTTWSIQLASPLRQQFILIAYDRADGSVEQQAAHAGQLIEETGPPALVIGSSFGAVVALELARCCPARCAGAVLIEPPMAASDEAARASVALLEKLDRRAEEQGDAAAAELFLRTVLDDAAFERMPRAFQDRSKAKWPQIRADTASLVAYRPRYAELAAVRVPMLLLGGERSAPYFRATLDALHAALPEATLEIVSGAGHMLHAEAPRRFAELVVGFAARLELG
jgi:pimeloyl-ACP methyl ester carboxylesterase